MNKADLKAVLYAYGIKQWELAEKMGIREDSLSRKLRHSLSPKDEAEVKTALKEIIREKDRKLIEEES